MASIEQLRELAERLGKATGPYRELDDMIWDELDSCRSGCPISYTSFVDAALALVERLLPGWNPAIEKTDLDWQAVLRSNWAVIGKTAPTPAIAILRAIVAALIAQAEAP